MTLTVVDRSGHVQGNEWQQVSESIGPTFHQFGDLVAELQGRIVFWIRDYEDKYSLFLTCKRAYSVLQGDFLAEDEQGADWFVEKVIDSSKNNFDVAARFIETRVAFLKRNAEDMRFTKLFTRLIIECARCTDFPVTDAAPGTVAQGRRGIIQGVDLVGVCLSDDGIATIAEHCEGLEALTLSSENQISCASFCNLLARRGKDLQVLVLHEMNLSDEHLTAIATYCKNLDSLSLIRCKCFTDTGLGTILKQCTALKKLNLASSCQLSGDCFASLAEHGNRLEAVLLWWCQRITCANLEILARRCTHLKTLFLSSVPAATSALLPIITRHGATLERLCLSGSSNVTSSHLAAVAEHCPNLKELFLEKCYDITDAALYPIARRCTLLERIVLSSTQISGAGLATVATHCKKLTAICAALCNITDEGVRSFLPLCAHLEELYLGGASISDASLALIAEYGTHLKKIGLNGCFNLTKEGIERLKAAFPEARIV